MLPSSLATNTSASACAGALAARRYHGDVVFRKGSEPFMTVAVAGPGSGPGGTEGVAIAEVSLKYIWDVVSEIRIGDEGIVYVLDPAGRLMLSVGLPQLAQISPRAGYASATPV